MTRDGIEALVKCWQDVLGLGHWNITVAWDVPVDRGVSAEIKVSADYEQASIRIQQEEAPLSDADDIGPTIPFTKWSEREAALIVVHELLHVFEKETARPVLAAEAVMPKAAYEVMYAWYLHGAESWVDRLAHVIVNAYLGGNE